MKVIEGYGSPNVDTIGDLNDLYVDLDTNDVYRCTSVKTIGEEWGDVTISARTLDNTVYTWEAAGGGGSGNSGGIPAIVPKTAVIMEGSGPSTYGEIIIDNFVPFIDGNKYLVLCCDSIAEVASVYTAEALETGVFVDLNIEIGDNPMTVRANIEDRYYALEGLADDGETVTIGVYGPVTI